MAKCKALTGSAVKELIFVSCRHYYNSPVQCKSQMLNLGVVNSTCVFIQTWTADCTGDFSV